MQIVSDRALSNPELSLFMVLQVCIVEELLFELTFVKHETAPAFPEIFSCFSFRFCSNEPLGNVALNDFSHQLSVDYVAVTIVDETYNDFLTQLLLDTAVKQLVEQF